MVTLYLTSVARTAPRTRFVGSVPVISMVTSYPTSITFISPRTWLHRDQGRPAREKGHLSYQGPNPAWYQGPRPRDLVVLAHPHCVLCLGRPYLPLRSPPSWAGLPCKLHDLWPLEAGGYLGVTGSIPDPGRSHMLERPSPAPQLLKPVLHERSHHSEKPAHGS
ncbi:unnamed protein product [Rangifer tarandus platyrhynchus]|uniref:Uncharacterized protein n=1 Tax=Rangifer tarandus platyrhynchus TaxID=3082113 RepID=A0ABN8Z9W8_RANTA|nr:unnamed protein product [Rangifer tarandus platyrhynchus]